MKLKLYNLTIFWLILLCFRVIANENGIPDIVKAFEEKLPKIGNRLGILERHLESEPWPESPFPVFQALESEPFEACGVSKNGEWLAFVSDDIQVWHAESRMIAYVIELPSVDGGFNVGLGRGKLIPKGCVVSNDGRHVVIFAGEPPPKGVLTIRTGTVQGDGSCFLIELESGALIKSWESSTSSAMPSFSWDGTWLTAGDRECHFAVNLIGDHEVKRVKAVGNNELWVANDGQWWAIPRERIPDWIQSHLTSADGLVLADSGGEVTDRISGGKCWAGWQNNGLAVDPKSDNIGWTGDERLRIRDGTADVILDPITLLTERAPEGHLWWAGNSGSLWCACDPPEFNGNKVIWKAKDGRKLSIFQCVGNEKIDNMMVRDDGRMAWIGIRQHKGSQVFSGWKIISVPDGKIVASGLRSPDSYISVEFIPDENRVLVDKTLYDLETGQIIAELPGQKLGRTSGGEILRAVPTGAEPLRNWRVVAFDFRGRELWKSDQTVSIGFDSSWGGANIAPDRKFAWLSPLYGFENSEHVLDLRTGRVQKLPDSGHALLPGWANNPVRLVAQGAGKEAVVWEAPWRASKIIGKNPILPISVKGRLPGFIRVDPNGVGAEILDDELNMVVTLDGWNSFDSVRELRISPNRRWLLAQTSYSGEHSIWDLNKGSKVADVFAVGGGNWVIVLPSGAYACSPGAADAMALRWRGRPYPLDRFDLQFNRPDLVIRAFGGDEARAKRMAAMVGFRQRTGTDNVGKTPEPKLPEVSEGAVSEVRILGLKREGLKASVDLRISGDWKDGELIVLHNGARIRPDSSRSGNLCQIAGIHLAAGRNVLGFEVRPSTGSPSPRAVMECDTGSGNVRPTLRALCIGIGDYPGVELDLPGAPNDAKSLAQALKKWDGEDQRVETELLLDAEASPETIIAKIGKLGSMTGPDDLLLVFLAAHGVNLKDSGYQVVGPKHQAGGELKDSLSLEHLVDAIGQAGALRRLLVLDTCETGNSGSPEFGHDVDDLFPTPGLGAGVAIFGASRWNQVAFESERTGHGFFTGALLEGLRIDPLRPRVGDGEIKLSHLAEFTRKQVEQQSAGNQSPVMIARSWRGDMKILKSGMLTMYYRMFDSAVDSRGVRDVIRDEKKGAGILPTAPYLRVVRNAIFARHGRTFESKELDAFFRSQNFYTPKPDFRESDLDANEREDVEWLVEGGGNPTSVTGVGKPSEPGIWIFHDSSLREVTDAELGRLDADGLWRARNEIYARHGLVFQSDRGKRYVAILGSAHQPVSTDMEVIQRSLNAVERKNVERIQKWEAARK